MKRTALAVGLKEIAVFLSSSEAHNKANINKTIADTLSVFEEIVPPARLVSTENYEPIGPGHEMIATVVSITNRCHY